MIKAINIMEILKFLFSKTIWQNVWANALFATLSIIVLYIIFITKKLGRLYCILGLNKTKKLTIYFSNTIVINAIDVNGRPNLYTGSAVPESEFKTIPDLANFIMQVDEKDPFLMRIIKVLKYGKINIEYELSPDNEIKVEANKNSNIITVGGPGYNNATSYYQKQGVKLLLSGAEIINNNKVIAIANMDYDYGILERITNDKQTIIIAAGAHINGTRGSVRYLTKNWKKIPKRDFAYLIKFPHPSKDMSGYDKPVDLTEY